jgi:hypothetical protein
VPVLHNVVCLKIWALLEIDKKPNESSIQACIDHLKDLLPPDLLKKLLSLKGHVVAEVSLPFH